MKQWKRWSIALLLALAWLNPARAELFGQVGVTSNYLWRGETQTNDGAAVFGGLDYLHRSGLYAGTWTSTIDPRRADDFPPESDDHRSDVINQDYELDLYGGYRYQAGRLGLDAGYIAYVYPRGERYNPAANRLEPNTGNEQDFAEWYLGVEYHIFAAKYWYSNDYRGAGSSLHYLETNLEIPLRQELSLGLHFGLKKGDPIDDGQTRVSDYHAVLTKGPFRFMLSQMSDNEDGRQSDNPRFSVSWVHRLDL